jgi:hypothetical protein
MKPSQWPHRIQGILRTRSLFVERTSRAYMSNSFCGVVNRTSSQVKLIVSRGYRSGMYAKRANASNLTTMLWLASVFRTISPFFCRQPIGLILYFPSKAGSLMRISLGWFAYSKNERKGDPTPAYSPVSHRKSSHEACWSPLGSKSASVDAPN